MTRPSMGRRRIVTGGEEDLYTRWRRLYCYLNNHNKARAKIKRTTRRRERREGRQAAREDE